VCPTAETNWTTLRQSQSIKTCTSATPGTVAEYYFWFAAATVENGRNRLGEPQAMEIRQGVH